MHHITSGNKEFLAVEMPEGATGFEIIETGALHYIWRGSDTYDCTQYWGNYKIIGLCSEIMKSEELAIKVVGFVSDEWYPDYQCETKRFTKATRSFASFMTKHSLTESTLIIEKI